MPAQAELDFTTTPPFEKGGPGGISAHQGARMTAAWMENLELLAEAPGGISKLRDLIVELAVSGRLMAQESTSDSWRNVRLGAVVELISGQHLSPDDYQMTPGDTTIPYLTGPAEFGPKIPAPTRFTSVRRAVARQGDVLLTVKGSGVGSTNVVNQPLLAISRQLMAVRPKEIDGEYLHLLLKSLLEHFQSKSIGIAIPGIGRADVLEVDVRLTTREEQHRIVAKVDELMALCDRLEARQADAQHAHARLVQALLDSLTQARDAEEFQAAWERLTQVFPEALATETTVEQLRRIVQQLGVMGRLTSRQPNDGLGADLLEEITASRANVKTTGRQGTRAADMSRKVPYELPAEWCWSTAEQVCEVIVDCPHSTPKFVPSGVLCLDTNSVKQGRIVPERTRYVDEETYAERVARLTPRFGDVVFAREGSVGESVVIPADLRCCLGQRVMLFRPCLLEPAYLQLALSEPSAVARQLAMHKGIGAKHVNVADMRAAWVPLPPLAEQRRIVAKVTELLALCDQLKAKIAAARAKHAQLAEALVKQAVATAAG